MPLSLPFPVETHEMYEVKVASPREGFFSAYGRANQDYEPHVSKTLLAALEPDMCFVDIGANVGVYTLAAARKVGPRGRCIAIEADSRNAMCIAYGADLNQFSNIEVWPVAASDTLRPEALLSDPKTNSGVRNVLDIGSREFSLVLGIPLDLIFKNARRVDVIKIDIEAREYKAMVGLRNTLERFSPTVFSEFTPRALPSVSGCTPEAYLQLFFTLSYEAFLLNRSDGAVVSYGQDTASLMTLLGTEEYKKVSFLDLMFKKAS